MKVKTNELIGAALDWAVAKCESIPLEYGLTDDELYSTNWAHGGPIIERLGIRTEPDRFSSTGFISWRADIPKGSPSPHGYRWAFGPTPLIAAMRCFVANRLGDEFEIPEELLK